MVFWLLNNADWRQHLLGHAFDGVEGRHARHRGREERVQPLQHAQVDDVECVLQLLLVN